MCQYDLKIFFLFYIHVPCFHYQLKLYIHVLCFHYELKKSFWWFSLNCDWPTDGRTHWCTCPFIQMRRRIWQGSYRLQCSPSLGPEGHHLRVVSTEKEVEVLITMLFLNASSHLHKRACPFVGPSVRRSVRNPFFRMRKNASFRLSRLPGVGDCKGK